MSHAVPYPALTTADVDYATKMQANLDYIRDLLILQQLTGTDISSSAAFASGQIAQYGVAGTSLNTGASGVPAAALVAGSVTEPKHAASSIVDGDIDYSSCKFVRTGATGIVINRGVKTITYSSATAVVTNVTWSTDSDEYIPFATGAVELMAFPIDSAAPGKPVNVWTVLNSGSSATGGQIVVASAESLTWANLSVAWIAIGK